MNIEEFRELLNNTHISIDYRDNLKYFDDNFGLQALKNLNTGEESFNRLFNSTTYHDSLHYALELDPLYKKTFGNMGRLNSGAFALKKINNQYYKCRKIIDEETAYECALEYKNIIRHYFIQINNDIENNCPHEKIKNDCVNQLFIKKTWFRKYIFLLFPDYFMPFYSKGKINEVFKYLNEISENYESKNDYFDDSAKFYEIANQFNLTSLEFGIKLMHILRKSTGIQESITIEEYPIIINRAIHHMNRTYTSMSDIADERRRIVGKNGEEYVLKYELNNNPNYAQSIKDVSQNTSLGYDIKSFDRDGNEKHIEVKTNSSDNHNRISFYISENEYDKLLNDEHYMIYYVTGINSDNPHITILNKDNFKEIEFKPVTYKVDAEISN